MTSPQNFRTAMRGFNREDVAHYLEYLSNKHQTEINQLNGDIDALQSALSKRPALGDSEKLTALESENQRLRSRAESAEASVSDLEERLAAFQAALAAAEAERQSLQARCTDLEQKSSHEGPAPVDQDALNAYRRAQNIEEESRVRAELVYYQTNGILSEATAKVDGVSAELTQLADQTLKELTRLQMSVSESKQVLQDAASMMKSIRPNS